MPRFLGDVVDQYGVLIEPGVLLINDKLQVSTIKNFPTVSTKSLTRHHHKYWNCGCVRQGQVQYIRFDYLVEQIWHSYSEYRWITATCSCGDTINLDPMTEWRLPFIVPLNSDLSRILETKLEKANEKS